MDIDGALYYVGGYRRWHVTIFVLLGVSLFHPICWHGLIIVFAGWEPEHWCKLPGNFSSSRDLNISSKIPTIKEENGKEGLSKCTMYSNPSFNDGNDDNDVVNITSCTNGWSYNNQGYFTIIEQWDLVCDRNYLSELSMTIYQAGGLFTEVGFSYMVDRFGRKWVHIVSHVGICLFGIATALSKTFITFVILRTLVSMLIVANFHSGLTCCMELFDSTRRTIAGIGLEFQWIFCYLLFPLLAYYVTDWRILQIIVSASSAVWIIYIWILPESPSWLVVNGRFDEAELVLHKMARWNGVKVNKDTQLLLLPSQVQEQSQGQGESQSQAQGQSYDVTVDLSSESALLQKQKQEEEEEKEKEEEEEEEEEVEGEGKKCGVVFLEAIPMQSLHGHATTTAAAAAKAATTTITTIATTTTQQKKQSSSVNVPVWDIFRDKYIRIYVIICSLLWFANCIVYYGLILSIPSLAGNRFINFLIMGFVELPATFLALYTTERFGRRLSTCVYHVAAGIPLAVVIFIPKTTDAGSDLSFVVITLVMISKFAISASFAVIILYTKELFPTNLRGTSSGVYQILGRIGSIAAPFAAYATKTSFYWMPNVAFGIISVGVGLLTLILPETGGHPLPQSIDDVHALHANKSPSSSSSSPSSSSAASATAAKKMIKKNTPLGDGDRNNSNSIET